MKELKKQIKKNKLSIILLFLTLIIIFTLSWFKSTFSDVTLDQLIFHIKVPLEGTNMNFFENYFEFLKNNVILIVFLLAIFILYLGDYFRHQYNIKIHCKVFKWDKKINWKIDDDRKKLFHIMKIIFVIAIVSTLLILDVHGYIYNELFPSKIFEKYYVDTKDIKLEFPEQKQNLIYIYLESMESSYSNINVQKVEQTNLIPNLEKLAKENINFSNTDKLGGAQEAFGTTWTVAGMVAQTSGIPMKLSIDGNSLGEYSAFLPGVYSLGEILEKEGYHNYLMMGSDKKFGGRSNYFEGHGHYEIYDYDSAKNEKKFKKEYWANWGFEDLKLFEYAKEKLSDLASQEQPFNFSLLTADTHPLEGYLDSTCQMLNTNPYANAIMCSDKKVYDFVKWIQSQSFYENTTIVISGDHLLMGNYLFPKDYEKTRTIYNVIINSKVNTENTKNRTFTTMDLFPTTLASLGVNIKGEQLGLGTNLFSNKKTLPEKMGLKKFNKELSKKSNYYNNELLYEKK